MQQQHFKSLKNNNNNNKKKKNVINSPQKNKQIIQKIALGYAGILTKNQ